MALSSSYARLRVSIAAGLVVAVASPGSGVIDAVLGAGDVSAWSTAWLDVRACEAGTRAVIEGRVYVDADGDGQLSQGDPVVPGAVVAWEHQVFTRADADGRYRLVVPDEPGIVWVRTPDGFGPGPVWRAVGGPAATAATAETTETAADGATADALSVDLALVPRPVELPLTFVVAADTHLGVGLYPGQDWLGPSRVHRALARATDTYPEPHFFTIVGDLTHNSHPEQFAALVSALDDLSTPFVPVPGNHDWYDGGAAYREHCGPIMHSFDAGGAHFAVLADELPDDELLAFLDADLSFAAPGQDVVVFTHVPLSAAMADALAARGVSHAFSGHWHSSRVVRHDGLLEFNTQPLVRGAIDFTPSGYRVVTYDGAAFTITHHTAVPSPVVEVVEPPAGACVPPGDVSIAAAVEVGDSRARVSATLRALPDNAGSDAVEGTPAVGTPVEVTVGLMAAGGWSYRGRVGPSARLPHGVPPGRYEVSVQVRAPGRAPVVQTATRCVARAEPPGAESPASPADWPQHGGGPGRMGAVASALSPRLAPVWTRAVGGHLQGGSPVVADGRVVVSIADYADGSSGGVAALDARTGDVLWRVRLGAAVRNAPAIGDGVVVVGDADGVIHAVDAATGAPLWRYDLAAVPSPFAPANYAAPLIADGAVYAGVPRQFAALDLRTGAPLWTADPAPSNRWLSTYSSASAEDGVVVATCGRGEDGFVVWDAYSGHELLRLPAPSSWSTNTSPVLADGVAYVGNAQAQVFAQDVRTGETLWQTELFPATSSYYALAATFALARDLLVIPTMYGELYAVDARTGAVVWRRALGSPGVVTVGHLSARGIGMPASPVVTDDVVWVGAPDGVLRAVSAVDGAVLSELDLGSPILSAPAPAGAWMFVATYDGAVHALRADDAARATAGSGRGAGRWPARLLAAVAALALVWLVWRLWLAALRRRGTSA